MEAVDKAEEGRPRHVEGDWSLKQVAIPFLILYVTTLIVGGVAVGAILHNQHEEFAHATAQLCAQSNDARVLGNQRARKLGLFVQSDAAKVAVEAGDGQGRRAGALRSDAVFWTTLVAGIAQPQPFLPQCVTKPLLARDATSQAQYEAALRQYVLPPVAPRRVP